MAREIPRSVDLYVHREFSVLLGVLAWRAGPLAMPLGLLAPLAAVGVVVAARFARRAGAGPGACWWVPLAFAGLYAGSVVVFFVSARHRLPIAPMVALYAAVGVCWLWREVVQRNGAPSSTRLRWTVAVALIGTAGLVNRSISAPTDAINFRAELYTDVGASLTERGDLVAAERYVRRALQIDDTLATGHSRLGLILARRGALAKAEACFRRSLVLDGGAAEVHWYLGNALLLQGRRAEAIAAVSRSLEIDPFSPEAHAVLADVLLESEQIEAAIEHFARALELPPRRGELLFDLARALGRVGRFADAIDCYRAGLDEVGQRPQALAELAWLLATCPDMRLRDCAAAIETAEILSASRDGHDPIALRTLGQCLAACGRTDRARLAIADAINAAIHAENGALAQSLNVILQDINAGSSPIAPQTDVP